MLGQININKTKRRMVTVVIFTMVIISFLSNFVILNQSEYIIITCVFDIVEYLCMVYLISKLKYCVHTKIALYCLVSFNLLNILNASGIIDYINYSVQYDIITILSITISSTIYYLHKKLSK